MRNRKYTLEILKPIVEESFSFSQVIRKLGLKVESGGNQTLIKDTIRLLGIDTSHFTGQGWARGQTRETNESIHQQLKKITYTPDMVFQNGMSFNGKILKRVMLESGVKYVCSVCNLFPIWNGQPLAFHVDHINGNRRDNRKENLRFLCPNCHQQTPTWGSKNKHR